MDEHQSTNSSNQKSHQEDNIYCMHCGTINIAGEYACDRCGERIYIPDPNRPPPLGFISCSKCAVANESHASYCATCGVEIDHATRISPDGADSLSNDRQAQSGNRRWRFSASKSNRVNRDDPAQQPLGNEDIKVRNTAHIRITRRKRPSQPQDDQPPIPQEIRRWNWSAFILGPIWGISHRLWWSALGLLPVLSLISFLRLPPQLTITTWVLVALVLGLKGNELAWRASAWESAERFLALQQRWTTMSILFAIGATVVFIVVLLSQQ